jgi:hypothetical protein
MFIARVVPRSLPPSVSRAQGQAGKKSFAKFRRFFTPVFLVTNLFQYDHESNFAIPKCSNCVNDRSAMFLQSVKDFRCLEQNCFYYRINPICLACCRPLAGESGDREDGGDRGDGGGRWGRWGRRQSCALLAFIRCYFSFVLPTKFVTGQATGGMTAIGNHAWEYWEHWGQ